MHASTPSSRFLIGQANTPARTGGVADWPEWRGRGRPGVWTESGILDRFPAQGLHVVVWRTPIHRAYAGPAAAEGLNASYNPTRCAGRHMKVTHTIKAAMFLLMLDQYSKLYRLAGQREVVLRQIYKDLKGTLQ